MAKVTKISRPPKDESSIDHFLPRIITIKSVQIDARPFEFANNKPTKYASVCPHCGQGIVITNAGIDKHGNVACPECHAGAPPILPPVVDPFINPVKSGIITQAALDPDLTDARHIDIKDDGLTALDRIKQSQ